MLGIFWYILGAFLVIDCCVLQGVALDDTLVHGHKSDDVDKH